MGINGPNPIFEGVDGPFTRMMKFRGTVELERMIARFETARRDESHPYHGNLLANPGPINAMFAYLEDLKDDYYEVDIPGPGESIERILRTWTKEHPTEYQSQAVIDGAWMVFELLKQYGGSTAIAKIVFLTSHHTHHVIGSGEGTPEKMAPKPGNPIPSRETLDHCATATGAIAIVYGRPENGRWEIEDYDKADDPEVRRVWENFTTEEDPEWTRRYLDGYAFGGKFVITLKDGTVIEHTQDVARAHPQHESGGWGRNEYLAKFERTTAGVVDPDVAKQFVDQVINLASLRTGDIAALSLPACVSLK